MATIPIFPLNAHVFPDGRLALRIFEARYLRMIREYGDCAPAFAMGMTGRAPEEQVLPVATLVDIIDFESLDDGLLGITVAGRSLIKVLAVNQDDDGLQHAEYAPLEGWRQPASAPSPLLRQVFEQLLQENRHLARLYRHHGDHPTSWYARRWLELLPLSSEVKLALVCQRSPDMAIELVNTMIDTSLPTATSGDGAIG